jgi:branched-chain amino acid transport system substrate-binding protein
MASKKSGVSRRTILKGAGSAAAAGAFATTITGFPHIAGAQAKVIRVGMPTILSGRVAILGTSSRAAVQLAVQ